MKKLLFLSIFLTSPLMADSITINFPDGERARILRAFVQAYGYKDTIPDPNNPGQTIPNPETKGQFTKRKIAAFVKDVVASIEVKEAAESAAEAARSNASSLDVQ